MHPDNWIGVIWPDKRAIYYRRDLPPPPEAVEALKTGAARMIDRKAGDQRAVEPARAATPKTRPERRGRSLHGRSVGQGREDS